MSKANELAARGYHVIQTTQRVNGSAWEKLANKVVTAASAGHTMIAVLVNHDHPHLRQIEQLVNQLNRTLGGVSVQFVTE